MKVSFTGALIQVALAHKGIHLLQELFTKLWINSDEEDKVVKVTKICKQLFKIDAHLKAKCQDWTDIPCLQTLH